MNITLSPAKAGTLLLVATDADRTLVRDTFNPDKAKARKAIAMQAGVTEEWLLDCISKGPGQYEYVKPTNDLSLTVRVREMHSKEAVEFTGEPLHVISNALEAGDAKVVEWTDSDTACFLDVDYHGPATDRPGSARLSFMVARLQPQPVLWFESRGGGVHALYLRREGISAAVLAAVGGFGWLALDSTAQVDLIPRSRTTSKPIHRQRPSSDISALRRFLRGSISEEEVEAYLEDNGFERGRAYEHNRCPAHPELASHGTPVYAGEAGISCKRCEAKGVILGSRRPGFFPYSSLAGGHEISEVARAVDNFVHWTHAAVILDARCRLRGRHARLAYEGMLRLRHGDDPRIAQVFQVGEHLVRGLGEWVTPDRYEAVKDIRGSLSRLPAVLTAEGKPCIERLDMFDQSVDLSRYGYAPIRPLHGMRVYGEFLGNDGGPLSLVLPPADLREPCNAPLLPRYVPEERRLPMDTAWERVERVFPGINRNYLLLLLAARGIAEGETGLPPFILCCGPSGAGKSQTAHIAASITGEKCGEVQWGGDVERFRQAYKTEKSKGLYVAVNEIFKDGRRSGRTYRDGIDVFLNLTSSSVSHTMYVGAMPMGVLPVSLLTDTHVPNEVRSDVQLGRRFVYVRLDSRLAWDKTIIASGIGSPGRFRSASVENAEACNAIVSYVIDTYFREKPIPLVEIAGALGFTTLELCDEAMDDPDALPELFRLVCQAPTLNDSRHKGRGWVKIGFHSDETELANAWSAVCDGVGSLDSFASSRKVMEVDWSTVVAVPAGTKCQVSKSGRGVALRFVQGHLPSGRYRVNGELLTELAA